MEPITIDVFSIFLFSPPSFRTIWIASRQPASPSERQVYNKNWHEMMWKPLADSNELKYKLRLSTHTTKYSK